MIKNEFESLTKVVVTQREYESIENDYMSCDLLKDEYCKKWKRTKYKILLEDRFNTIKEIEQLNIDILHKARDYYNNDEYSKSNTCYSINDKLNQILGLE